MTDLDAQIAAVLAWLDTCSDLKYRDAATLIRQLAAELVKAMANEGRLVAFARRVNTYADHANDCLISEGMDDCTCGYERAEADLYASITSAGGTTDE